MTYTPPEGVTIGSFTTDTLPASFSAPADVVVTYKIYGTEEGVGTATAEGEPEGYKITLSVDDTPRPIYIGDTKLYEDDFLDFDEQKIITNTETTVFTGTENDWVYYGKVEGHDAYYYSYSATTDFRDFKYLYCADYRTVKYVGPGLVRDKTIRYQFDAVSSKWNINRIYIFDDRFDSLSDFKDHLQGLYSSGAPLIVTRQTATSESKNPSVPFPIITTHDGENTISSTETLGDVELTGDWLAIMGSTEDESIDIGFTVDAEEYIAFVTVDDESSIQVTDTITMPSSADSFTLEVVSWGRERYTDTVYNALS